jgi:hypothetical protein
MTGTNVGFNSNIQKQYVGPHWGLDWAEVERRRMAYPENIKKEITELQSRGYEVFKKA